MVLFGISERATIVNLGLGGTVALQEDATP